VAPATTALAPVTFAAATTGAPSPLAPTTTAASATAPATRPAATPTPGITDAVSSGIPAARPSGNAPAVTPPPLGNAESSLKATGFDADETKTLLDELTRQIGSRVVGSEGEQKAADWLEKYYKSYGYTQVSRQEFPFSTPQVRIGVLLEGDPSSRDSLKAFGTLLSKPKSSESKGPATVYKEGDDFKGKIVIIPGVSQANQIKPKLEAISKTGAIGILLNLPAESLDFKIFEDIEVPVIGVGAQQLQNVQTSLDNGNNPKEFTFQTSYQAGVGGKGQNIIATRPGPKPEAPLLIFGGHYDTVAGTVGASDNSSGTVVTLELAKVLFKKFPDYELRFINFSGEEIGLLGSLYYAGKLTAEEKKRITAYINIDAVGVGDRFVAIGTGELVNQAVAVASQNGVRLEAFNLGGTGAGSDHEAFIRNGIKAFMLGRWIDPLLHNPGDIPERVYPQALLLAGGIAILTAQKLVGA